jgi:hypothetical protein
MRRVIRNSARTIARQSKRWIALENLDRDANDTKTPEQINAEVFGKGNIFSPRPWLAHFPLGKHDLPAHDLIDGSNGVVSPLVNGLALYWMRVAYSAAAPKFDGEQIKANLRRANVHYINELNLLAQADATIYPKGGPVDTPSNVELGNESEFNVRWMIQSRTPYANRTMVPYLAEHGYTRGISKNDRNVMKQLKRDAIKAMGHAYAGRLVIPDEWEIQGYQIDVKAWQSLNRGMLNNERWGLRFFEVPTSVQQQALKSVWQAINEPERILSAEPPAKPQQPRTPKQMEELDTLQIRRGDSMKDLAAKFRSWGETQGIDPEQISQEISQLQREINKLKRQKKAGKK